MNSETRTHKRLRLMIDMLERKIRLRAHQLYEQRGKNGGKDLEDWIKAEAEILRSGVVSLVWRTRRLLEALHEPDSS